MARKGFAVVLSLLVLVIGLLAAWLWMIHMPGHSYRGQSADLTPSQAELADALRRDVDMFAGTIGPRHMGRPDKLAATVNFIETSLLQAGLTVRRREYPVRGQTAANLEVEWTGTRFPDEILIVGAHYDTVPETPGADDNASGVAALLAAARALQGRRFSRTLRLVAFANEEPPYYHGETMGSLAYARGCQARGEKVVGMLAFEMLGVYSQVEKSQRYPPPLSWFYPSRGNFVAFVGDLDSRPLVRRAVASFRRHARFPSEGAALPASLPGIGYSDHWSFWQVGVPALMVTDTAFFRNPRYHEAADTPQTLDYPRMALVVDGLIQVIVDLTGPAE